MDSRAIVAARREKIKIPRAPLFSRFRRVKIIEKNSLFPGIWYIETMDRNGLPPQLRRRTRGLPAGFRRNGTGGEGSVPVPGGRHGPQGPSAGLRGLRAGLLGGAAFIGLFLAWGLLIAAAGAAAVFTLVYQVSAPRKKAPSIPVEGVSPEMYREILARGWDRIGELDESIRRAPPGPVRDKIRGIRQAAAGVLEEIQDNPAILQTARQFLFHYLSAANSVVRKYLDLGLRDLENPEVDDTLRKVENSLDLIGKAFAQQRARLLQKDLVELDAEVQVLIRSLEMDGFGGTG